MKHFPSLAVDGRLDGNCSQTNYEKDPWWRVDLHSEYYIMAIVILNCCDNIMKNVEVRIGSNENGELNQLCGHIDAVENNENAIILCSTDLSGRYVHLNVRGKNSSLSMCEVRIYETLGNTLCMHFVFAACKIISPCCFFFYLNLGIPTCPFFSRQVILSCAVESRK